MKYAIELKIRALFKAEVTLDSVKAIFIGEPLFISIQHYPALIIFMQRQIPFQEETGIWVYRYQGSVGCEAFIQDNYTVKDRESDVESLLTIRNILDIASGIIEDNISLGSIIDDEGERVRAIETGEKVYGLLNRQDNMLNRGDFTIEVETQKQRST